MAKKVRRRNCRGVGAKVRRFVWPGRKGFHTETWSGNKRTQKIGKEIRWVRKDIERRNSKIWSKAPWAKRR